MRVPLLLLCVALSGCLGQVNIVVDGAGARAPWLHVWESCVGSGHAALGLRADWQEHLQRAHRDLGFQRVRFHGVFDDDMNVVLPTGVSFYNVFVVYDYIMAQGMTPFVELGFTPGAYKTANTTLMHYQANISPPKEAEWIALIKLFATELINRYGLALVSTFNFEVYNEFNCGFLAAPNPRTAYYQLYNITAFALKSVNAQLRIGGPATCQSAYLTDFLEFVTENSIPIDFVSTHEYPTDPAVVGGNMVPVMAKALQQVQSFNASIPLYYSEFNDGLFSNPPMHDYPFAASYIVKTVANLNGLVPLVSFWTFSDVFEEQGFPAQEFDKPTSTGWGLLSASGIEKPIYRAFQLLHQSGDVRIPIVQTVDARVGSLAVLNTATSEVMVFVWSNVWPDQSAGATSMRPGSAASAVLSFKGFNVTTLKYAAIDDNNANAPQAWRNDGRPLYLKPADVKRYRAASQLNWRPCFPGQFTVAEQGLMVFVAKVAKQ